MNLSESAARMKMLLGACVLNDKELSGAVLERFDVEAELFDAIRKHLRPGIPLIEMDCEINAPEFAAACAKALLGSLR